MKSRLSKMIFILILTLGLTGCTLRTYTVTKERLDQGISGNQGYMEGSVPAGEAKERSLTRETFVAEIEFYSPLKFKFGKGKPLSAKTKCISRIKSEDEDMGGNLGYLIGGPGDSSDIDSAAIYQLKGGKLCSDKGKKGVSSIEYIVKDGDTLQKISKKFYGCYSKWIKIYNANEDTLKDRNDIMPGQTLNIPQ